MQKVIKALNLQKLTYHIYVDVETGQFYEVQEKAIYLADKKVLTSLVKNLLKETDNHLTKLQYQNAVGLIEEALQVLKVIQYGQDIQELKKKLTQIKTTQLMEKLARRKEELKEEVGDENQEA